MTGETVKTLSRRMGGRLAKPPVSRARQDEGREGGRRGRHDLRATAPETNIALHLALYGVTWANTHLSCAWNATRAGRLTTRFADAPPHFCCSAHARASPIKRLREAEAWTRTPAQALHISALDHSPQRQHIRSLARACLCSNARTQPHANHLRTLARAARATTSRCLLPTRLTAPAPHHLFLAWTQNQACAKSGVRRGDELNRQQ